MPALAVGEDLLGDVAGLLGFVAHIDERAAARPTARSDQRFLREALRGKIDDGVGRRQDRLRRAVVVLQRDQLGRRREVAGKVEDVAHRGGAERVDRLGVVADDREARGRSA